MTIQGTYSAETTPRDLPISDGVSTAPEETPVLAGESAAMRRLRLQIDRIGPHFRTVLLRGESGTGKHLVARALHARSNRSQTPFTVWHSARLDDLEQDGPRHLSLFLKAAKQGTVFLDAMDEMSPRAQKNLLTALNQRSGLRVIAAAGQDLRVMATAGLFRHDLYQRLSTVEIVLDPLRSRPEDIPELAGFFLRRFAQRYRKPVDTIAPQAISMLLEHPWPGNVRELENVVRNGVLQCEGMVLLPEHLSWIVRADKTSEDWNARRPTAEPARLQDVIDRHIIRVLQECSGNKVRAAEVLGISRSTLYRMLDACASEAKARQA